MRIVDHLAEVFTATLKKKAPGSPDLRTLPRVMARLLMTANRAKEVLSANKEASVYVRDVLRWELCIVTGACVNGARMFGLRF